MRDAQAALTALAGAWRRRCPALVLGVGGSNGKTTTKELLASILAQAGPTLATRGNLNNHIGVPLTLLRLEPSHRYAVIEMGANHPGEIAALAAVAAPSIALVTNAGDEHLEGFGDLAGVAHAEGEMFAALPPDGTAVINADDPFHELWRTMARTARVLRFGIESPAEARATAIQGRIEARRLRHRVHADARGRAGARAPRARRPPQRAERARRRGGGARGRRRARGDRRGPRAHAAGRRPPAARRPAPRGSWLIDDSYNANPSSVRAGIDVLCSLPGEHWLVLGEMAELGNQTEASHIGVGDYARRAGITRVFAMGDAARHAVAAYGTRANWYPDAASLAAGGRGRHRHGRHGADQGFAGQSPRARRRPAAGAARRRPATETEGPACCSTCLTGWRGTTAVSASSAT